MNEEELKTQIHINLIVSRKLIADSEKILADAIKRENWKRAAELDSYIDGMRQILVCFEGLES